MIKNILNNIKRDYFTLLLFFISTLILIEFTNNNVSNVFQVGDFNIKDEKIFILKSKNPTQLLPTLKRVSFEKFKDLILYLENKGYNIDSSMQIEGSSISTDNLDKIDRINILNKNSKEFIQIKTLYNYKFTNTKIIEPDKPIPIIIGYNYRKYLKIGDILTLDTYIGKRDFIVKDYIVKNFKRRIFSSGGYKHYNNRIIAQSFIDRYSFDKVENYKENFLRRYFIISFFNKEFNLSELNELTENTNILFPKGSYILANDSIEYRFYKSRFLETLFRNLTLSITLIVLILLFVLVFILFRIEKSKKKYALLKIYGVNLYKQSFEIVLDFMVILFISFSVATIFKILPLLNRFNSHKTNISFISYLNYYVKGLYFEKTIWLYLFLFSIIFVFSYLISYFSLIKLRENIILREGEN